MTKLSLLALAGALAAMPSLSFAAETGPSGSAVIRITYDANGQPTCSVARPAAGSDTPVGTVIPCPAAVKPRTGDNSGTGSGNGSTNGNAGSGTSGNSSNSSGFGSGNTGIVPPRPETPDTAVTLANVSRGDTLSSVLRFANFGDRAAAPKVEIVNPADGTVLTSWSGPEIPGHGSLQVSFSTIAATLPASAPVTVSVRVTAGYRGTVQHLLAQNGSIVADASACGSAALAPRERIGYLPADGSTTHSVVRIVNTGREALTAKLVLRDAATGTAKGTWTSPAIPAHGDSSFAFAALVTDAGLDGSIASYMVDSEELLPSLRLEAGQTNAAGVLVDETIACTVTPG